MEIFTVIALVFIGYKLQGIYNVLFDMYRDMVKWKSEESENRYFPDNHNLENE